MFTHQPKMHIFAILLIFMLLISLTFPVLASAARPEPPPPVVVPDVVLLLIPALAGGIGIKLINFLKTQLGWTNPEDKVKNIWLSFGVSVALAILALVITQSFLPLSGPETLITWIALAFTVATLIYKSMAQTPEPISNG